MREDNQVEDGSPDAIDLSPYYRVEPCEQEPYFTVQYCGVGDGLYYGPQEGNGFWLAQAFALGVETRLLWPGQDLKVIARATACIDQATAELVDRDNAPIGDRLKAALGEYGALHVELHSKASLPGRPGPCLAPAAAASCYPGARDHQHG